MEVMMMMMNPNGGNDDDHTEQAPFAKVVSFPKSLAISFATRFACKVPCLIFIFLLILFVLLILLKLLFLFKLLSEFLLIVNCGLQEGFQPPHQWTIPKQVTEVRPSH